MRHFYLPRTIFILMEDSIWRWKSWAENIDPGSWPFPGSSERSEQDTMDNNLRDGFQTAWRISGCLGLGGVEH